MEIKYRTWHKAVAPKPLKLQIPGWAGVFNQHSNGDESQPWHCLPFIEASTYGLELIYPFESDCCVYLKDNKVIFDGDFSKEQKECSNVQLPPFMNFTENHFGMTSALDIKVPEGYVLRTECHPRFYTDITNTVPCCLPGHIQTEWWPKIFFVVFKNPTPGQTIVFKKGEPYGQILIVPRKTHYEIKEMTRSEILQRNLVDNKIEKHCKKFAKTWQDNSGQIFDDKYKVLSSVFLKKGEITSFLDDFEKATKTLKKIRGKLFIKRKNESI
jgi:hypothetical protein